jgi:hypothetical protein
LILIREPVEIMPLPTAEVAFVPARFRELEQEAETVDVVGFPGGESEVGAGRVHSRA